MSRRRRRGHVKKRAPEVHVDVYGDENGPAMFVYRELGDIYGFCWKCGDPAEWDHGRSARDQMCLLCRAVCGES